MNLRKILNTSMCLTVTVSLLSLNAWGQSTATERMSPELLWKLGRLGDSATSTDGKQLAYTVRRYELQEDKGYSSFFHVDLESGDESTLLEKWASIGSVQWRTTDGGEFLYFEGAPLPENEDDETPSTQAWQIDPKTGKSRQLTSIEDGISNLKVSPAGDKIAFTVSVKMDDKPSELYPDLPKADARIIDSLMYRHWNAWHDYSYSHLHVASLQEDGTFGEPVDLMNDVKADCPVPPFGGSEQFCWSPDGKELAFTMKDVSDWAQSTNSDVFLIAADGSRPPENISKSNLGYDNNPSFSPDGKYLVYNSMERPGFESDRNRLMIVDRQANTSRELTAGLDQNASHPVWLPDSSALVFTSETTGTNQLFKIDIASGSRAQVSRGRFNWEAVAALSSNALLTKQTSMLRAAELVQLSLADGSTRKISAINGEIYKNLQLPNVEERLVEASDGEKIHCWVIYPPDFDPESDKKWPMLTYCQGGPQSQIGQWFSYRWNFHLMAAQGYVVLAPNRRGLPGFGQQWNDEISRDWGGQAMRDLLSATDDMIKEPFIDPERVGAIGASFGGYTIYWMMGNSGDRFCAMVAHCGVFNLESMYGSTEELFFVNWDLGGPYWKSDAIFEGYQKFSPHRFVGNWKTPLLVVHGQKDFRVPVTQGMEAFTAAQVQGVPSRFLYYPNEGHWVLKPQNGVLWHRIFFDWLDRYCKRDSRDEAIRSNQ